MDCLNRTNVGASAAFGANFGINFINITFRNSFNGTLIDAGSASSAIITNFVSHDFVILRPKDLGQG